MRHLLALAFVTLSLGAKDAVVRVAPAFVGPTALDALPKDADLTKAKPDDFVSKNTRFEFTDAAKGSARADGKRLPKADVLTFAEMPLVESLVRFDAAGNEVTLIVYSVGDNGEISETAFDGKVDALTKVLTSSYGKPATPSAAASAIVRAKSLAWKCPAGQVRLEWSSTRANASRGQAYRAEFIRVVIGPTPPSSLVVRAPKWVPADQLRTNEQGDKWIGTVPMVDQGEKGYCAVATSERVLRYFGKDADQHELAQVCQTEQGTSAQKFEEQMKRVASKFNLRFQVGLSGVDERFLGDLVKDYVRAGKKKGGVACPPALEQNHYLIYQALDMLDDNQLIAVRQADKPGLARMDKFIRDSIDRADPVIWCVHLGIVKEAGLPQASGGHMRLIIGYNPKTAEVLYSDSWGKGHELKRMKLADAWAETFGYSVMHPN